MHSLAYVLRDEGIIVVLLHPGSVRTERQVFDYAGILETDDSVRQMIDTIASLTIEDTGRFLMYDGTTQPW